MEQQTVTGADTGHTIQINLPETAGEVRVELPVQGAHAGMVAVLVQPDGTEEILKSTLVTEGGLSVVLSGSSTIKLVDNTQQFGDVGDASWYQEAVRFVTSRGIFNGTEGGGFSPDLEMSRAMLMTVLAR